MEQLILKGLGGGADQATLAAQQDRHQVGKGLAHARPGFDDQVALGLQRLPYRQRHPGLGLAGLETWIRQGQISLSAEGLPNPGFEQAVDDGHVSVVEIRFGMVGQWGPSEAVTGRQVYSFPHA